MGWVGYLMRRTDNSWKASVTEWQLRKCRSQDRQRGGERKLEPLPEQVGLPPKNFIGKPLIKQLQK